MRAKIRTIRSGIQALLLAAFVLPTAFVLLGAAGEHAWQEISRSDDVVVYRKQVPGSPVMSYRGVAEIPAPLPRIMSIIKDAKRRPEWGEWVEKSEVVRELSPTERIEYVEFDAPWPVKDRDVVVRSKVDYDDANDRVVIHVTSVEDSAKPPVEGDVRAQVYSGDFVLKPVAGGARTHVEAEVSGDPKGSIPKWAVDLVQKSAPKRALRNLRKQLEKTDIADDAEAARFLARNGLTAR